MVPLPVLNVVLDRVDKLDDCHTLWHVFSRCRDNVDDGARLENLSWRLWTRKLSSARTGIARPAFSLAASDSDLSGFTSDDTSSVSSAATSSKARRAPINARSEQELRADERQMASSQPSRALSDDVRPALEPRSRSSPELHPGKFITELIPNRLVVPTAPAHAYVQSPAILPSSPSPAVIARATPIAHSHPLLLARPILETVVMPSTPPSAATASYPAVVVVNPTPHPTPPATPRIPDELPQSHQTSGAGITSATLHVPGSDLPIKSHSQSGEHEADARKAASRFYLCQEPVTPEQSPSESSTMGSTAATNSTGPIGAPMRDSSVPPAPPNSVPKTSRSLDEVYIGVAGSATSSNFRAPSSIGSTSRGRKGKEAVRHHVGNRAGSRPTFAHRNQHHKAHTPARAHTPAAKASAPARGAQQQPLMAQELPSAPALPAAIIPAVHGTNNSREHPQTPAPAAAVPPAAAAVAAHNTATVRPASPRVSLFKMLAPANRRVELATSSEFDSDSADDSSWASEDEVDEVEREREHAVKESAESKQPDIAREAALEAQRQRELFAKLPTRSWSNLDQVQRPGLLTSLFRPDLAQSGLVRHSATVQDLTVAPRIMSSPALSKAPAMAPLMQQVTAQPTRTGYRPRARPEGEPEDSDTDDVDPEDTVQLSRSVAQRKLEELAGNHRRRQQQQHQQYQPQPEPGPSFLPAAIAPALPIPFDHARLPAPLPQQTPRTTRRNMLASEMSESLRRNLLWERQVTKRSHGLPRNTSAGSRLQPLTSAVATEDENEARRKKAIARNKSFGDDFHRSGW